MKNRFWLKQAFFAGLAVLSLSCASIKKKALSAYLKSFQDKKAEGVKWASPPSPYKLQPHSTLDALWRNSKTGSSISYFSNCSKTPKALEAFQKDSFPQDLKYKLLKQTKTQGGLYSILEISEYPQKVYSGVFTVKKGDCHFNINLVAGSHPSFKREEPVFKAFIRSFRLK